MGFIFDGIPSQQMKIRARLTNWQVSPSLRNSFEPVPGKAGVLDFGSDSSERIITVKCGVFPQKNFAGLVHILDNVAGWLDPANGLKQLILDDVPDRFYRARLADTVDCERLLRSAGAFDLQFICPDPHAYTLEDESTTIATTGIHSFVRQIGNTFSEPVYMLSGVISSSANARIKITTNGEELNIIGPLTSEETLVIDSALVTAKVINSAGETLRNGLPHMETMDFPSLRSGSNDIQISVNNATFSEIQIKANSRWR